MERPSTIDEWAAWLLHRRHGDDPEQRRKALEQLEPIRRRVLDNARMRSGDVVVDVGAGDGLIGFGAVDAVGPTGRVILSDVSDDLVDHARELAIELGLDDRVSCVTARAEELSPIDDRSVDVVTTRSVLIYVSDKASAFREFFRVLRPGGRVSIFEPINSYFADSPDEFWGFDARPVRDLVEKVWAFEGGDDDADDPMMNFTEKDLVRFAEEAGFDEVRVELDVEVRPGSWAVDWERLLKMSPNPNALAVGDALRGALSDEEFARFERHIRPQADEGAGTIRSAFAYLTALKR
jgi:SAM-dependent methyltransferase